MKTHEPAWRTGLRAWSASRRLLVSATLGGGVAAACRVVGSPWVESLLVGWCSFALLSLLLSGLTLGLHGDIPRPDEVARNDQSSTAMLMVVLLGCAASVTAIGALLLTSRDLPPGERWPHGLLAVVAIVLSWLLIHVRFAFHYAHRDLETRPASKGRTALDFPSTPKPDYLDYLYFSFVVGMTSQVSDVTVHTRTMRRLVLWHSLLSFGFNLLILALAVNTLAALFQ
ncbi:MULTISPECIES: DUF1345 domain-containing protein [unclassified Methylibium]|uniref:DUF1345 domain-containing protein n=1 Tax=unclassified Methylibium TaxID=2633235 RepID=UPI00138F9269|nr:DUF1345 domain-containing protein [Methylibium sp. Root1272]MDP1790008.1 DUF1345 domain-containing protein [Methylibium sp.]